MSYNSTFSYNFSSDAKIDDLGELNKRIYKDLNSGMGTSLVTKFSNGDGTEGYAIEFDDYYGEFRDTEAFAKLLSGFIVKGSVVLTWVGDDGEVLAIRVSLNRVVNLISVLVPEYLVAGVQSYILERAKFTV